MRDRLSEMEYIFHDTDKELPETYEHLARLEAVLGKREYAVLTIYALSISLSVGATVLLMASPLSAVLLIGQALSTFLVLTILERKGRKPTGSSASVKGKTPLRPGVAERPTPAEQP
jgi:hypothetical protein